MRRKLTLFFVFLFASFFLVLLRKSNHSVLQQQQQHLDTFLSHPPHKLCFVAVVFNMQRHIRPWILYHHKYAGGPQSLFVLYDDGSTDNPALELASLTRQNDWNIEVELRNTSQFSNGFDRQRQIYIDAHNSLRDRCEFVANVDLDGTFHPKLAHPLPSHFSSRNSSTSNPPLSLPLHATLPQNTLFRLA